MISNNCKLPRSDKNTESLIVGISIGILILNAVVIGPAPSTLAASKTSLEIACNPAI